MIKTEVLINGRLTYIKQISLSKMERVYVYNLLGHVDGLLEEVTFITPLPSIQQTKRKILHNTYNEIVDYLKEYNGTAADLSSNGDDPNVAVREEV